MKSEQLPLSWQSLKQQWVEELRAEEGQFRTDT